MTDDWNDEELELFQKRWTCDTIVVSDPNTDKVDRLSDRTGDWKAWALPVFKDMNFDAITVKHQNYTETWRDSAAYRASFELIEQTVLKQNHLEVSICMCLGLGSFTGVHHEDIAEKSRNRSLSQLVAFEGWVEQLSKRRYFQFFVPGLTTYVQELDSISNTSISKTPCSLFWIGTSSFLAVTSM